MTDKLRALLVSVGVLVSAGTVYVVSLPGPDTDRSDLIDAGIAGCDPVVIRATAIVPPAGARARMEDAGLSVADFSLRDGGSRRRHHVQFISRARLCEGDLVLPIQANGETGLFIYGRMELLTDAGSGPVRPVTDEQCGCRRRGESCRIRAFDGGLVQAPLDTELQPGTFGGAGCERKTCGELAGLQGTSMPEVCQ